METLPTHLTTGAIVVSLDDLTTEDLAHLLYLKRTETDRIRQAEDDELLSDMWRLLPSIERPEAVEIGRQLQNFHPSIVLAEHFDSFAFARFGTLSIPTIGYYLCSASVAA